VFEVLPAQPLQSSMSEFPVQTRPPESRPDRPDDRADRHYRTTRLIFREFSPRFGPISALRHNIAECNLL